jgi:hypothetical protein
MYDIFLSHNRREKPWVRQLAKLLKDEGLSVFFDEDSIAPGENIVAAIEKAVTGSRHILLVISRASMESRWVAMETQYAVHDDPDAQSGRLVPLVIDDLRTDALRPALRTINCVDLTDPVTRDDHLRKVLQYLGVESWATVPLPAWPDSYRAAAVSGSRVSVGGIESILDWGWDGVRLLQEFIALDYETLAGLKVSHEGTPAQWAPIFMEHPQTWRMLFDRPKNVIGYWHYVPLFPEDYDLAISGRLLDSLITADRAQYFEFPGRYRIYFVQVCLRPRFRFPRITSLLFTSVFNVLLELAREGVFVEEVCANAYTETGRALCRTFRLTTMGPHIEHGEIFASNVGAVLSHSLAARLPQLHALYKKEGLLEIDTIGLANNGAKSPPGGGSG